MVANMVADMAANMEVHMMADMDVHIVADTEGDKVADMVADMEVDKMADIGGVGVSRPGGPKAGPKGCQLEVGPRRGPRLLVVILRNCSN